jgi:hypothetical protein
MGYKIAAIAVLLLLGMTFWASYSGWGLRSTARAEAEARRRGHSIRGGSGGGLYGRPYGRGYYGGGGPRFGK